MGYIKSYKYAYLSAPIMVKWAQLFGVSELAKWAKLVWKVHLKVNFEKNEKKIHEPSMDHTLKLDFVRFIYLE